MDRLDIMLAFARRRTNWREYQKQLAELDAQERAEGIGEMFKLDLYWVEVIGFSKCRRNVHYRRLSRKKRGRPPSEWMPVTMFMLLAQRAGRFERAATGELVWVEPKEPANAPV
jgi:hypothetical protein